MHTQVAIVGGGLAGLVAARRLYEAGIDFRLLEARDRLGGRILSLDADGYPAADGFDVGPSWFWPDMQPEMDELVRTLGLTAFPQHEEGDMLVERTAREGARRVRAMRQEPSSMRLSGGAGALVTALSAGLPSFRLCLGAKVTQMSIVGRSIALFVSGQDSTAQRVEAAQVILAAPPRLLAATLSFEPVLDPRSLSKWLDTPTWMAPHAKFVAVYERPFWRDDGLSGAAQSYIGPLVEIHDATTASGRAALFGFVGVDAARREAMGDKVLIDAAMAQLARIFGPRAADPTATLFKDWSADALTATVADRVSGGHPAASREPWLHAPWTDLLTLASSETSLAAPGYLAGAVEAGGRAAKAAAHRLKATSGDTLAC